MDSPRTLNRLGGVLEYFKRRKFGIVRALRVGEAYMLSKGSLYVDVWAPTKDYVKYHDYDKLVKGLELDRVHALVIVSYRPYTIMDYLKRLMDAAERWYGVSSKVRMIGVSEADVERGVEDAVERLHTYFAELISRPAASGEECPRCMGGNLQRYQFDDYFSQKLYGVARQYVYICEKCGLRISRQELLLAPKGSS